ncbi:hypothetical protein [Streptomyces sp. NPDC096033]|uniref:hypothetical protein n=1 Tax=Streptomyces sp. NPDC096033 TaxID=3366071 RepID=UPI0037F19997
MPTISQILDLADILAAEGSLETDQPANDADVREALKVALAATREAYRIAYKNTGGDLDNDTVDGLDLAECTIRDALDALAA